MLAVLNPGGRDRTRVFPDGAGSPEAPGHPPVNYHAYAACCGGGFFQREEDIPRDCRRVMVLLRRNGLGAAARAIARLRPRGVCVRISWKESGLLQVSEALATPRRLEAFQALCREAGGFVSSTPDLLALYRGGGCGAGDFVPTPYPVEEPQWSFAIPSGERRGIFIGTREFGVPSRNHFLALELASSIGVPVTVIQSERWPFRSFPKNVRVVHGKLSYLPYLRLMASHRLVFQLDRSAVPGQVAGDALLCGIPCVGGDGAVERLAFPSLCGVALNATELLDAARHLLSDERAYQEAVAQSRRLALERLSFSRVRGQLLAAFAGAS